METTIYDAWNLQDKKPFGALSVYQSASFWIRPPKTLSVQQAHFFVHTDAGAPFSIDMQPMQEDNGQPAFYCAYAFAKPGLYWYRFTLDTATGTQNLYRDIGGKAILTDAKQTGKEWQITVYAANFHTPKWLTGGTLYQIFPDRFFRAKKETNPSFPDKIPPDTATPSSFPNKNEENSTTDPSFPDRILQEDWNSPPPFQAEEDPTTFSNTYYGGNLAGITQKLPYLKELGITALYLNPIFEAHANHRYNTANYLKIDPWLGTETDFRTLCQTARKMGIRILLDGVFSHTGDDSLYFNRSGRYGDGGAYQSQESPYYPWYDFHTWPDSYRCWWNFKTLPQVNQLSPGFLALITGENGVISHWMEAGAAGWRLDVADELQSAFIKALRKRIKTQDPDAVLLGEVWEDASNKTAYGERRPYFLGQELDGVMNYPFRTAILSFLRGGDAFDFHLTVTGIVENYPPPAMQTTMNLLGTHDTARILTALAGEPADGHDRAWKATQHLSPEARKKGLTLLHLAFALLFCLPGVPCLYYGDETGAEGYEDPFCRAPFPWGKENTALIKTIRSLAKIRRTSPALADGDYTTLLARDGLLAFRRRTDKAQIICAVNRTDTALALTPPEDGQKYALLLGEESSDFWLISPLQFKIYGMGEEK